MDKHTAFNIMRIVLLVFVIVFGIWFAVLVLHGNSLYAHEGHGYVHMEGSSGPIIGQRQCGFEEFVWFVDGDHDGKVDLCRRVIFNHGQIHVKDYEPEDGTCLCK